MEIKGQELENLFVNGELFLKMGDDQRLVFFIEDEADTFQSAKEILTMFRLYRNSSAYEKLVKNIYIIGLNGKCISERKGLYYKETGEIRENPYLKQILEMPDQISILPEHFPDYDQDRQSDNVFSMGKVFYNNITLEPVGIIMIDMDRDEIFRQYSSYRFFDIGRISLVCGETPPQELQIQDLDGWKEFMDRGKGIPISSGFTNNGDVQTLYVSYRTRYPDLSILGSISVNHLFSGVRKARNLFLAFFLLSGLLIYLVYYIISYGLMKPLEEVRENMIKAALGNFNASHKHYLWNMIPDISRSSDMMMLDLQTYIDKTDEEHRKYLDAELRAYQAQINPHFLYNTLDTILWSAVDQGNKEIEDLVYDMSQFFRISLSKGAEFIDVREEIECITSYLKIQKLRYASVMDFSIYVEEEMKNCRMLKLLLQPVVENALYHGLKNKRSLGKIIVRGIRKDDRLIFTVRDTGIGILEKRLEELNRQLENPHEYSNSAETGVGILNVQSRIRMKYGQGYGMTLSSVHGEGTTVEIVIPILSSESSVN